MVLPESKNRVGLGRALMKGRNIGAGAAQKGGKGRVRGMQSHVCDVPFIFKNSPKTDFIAFTVHNWLPERVWVHYRASCVRWVFGYSRACRYRFHSRSVQTYHMLPWVIMNWFSIGKPSIELTSTFFFPREVECQGHSQVPNQSLPPQCRRWEEISLKTSRQCTAPYRSAPPTMGLKHHSRAAWPSWERGIPSLAAWVGWAPREQGLIDDTFWTKSWDVEAIMESDWTIRFDCADCWRKESFDV